MMSDHLSPQQQRRLEKIEAALADLDAKAKPLKAERKRLLTLARVRKHRA